MADIRPPRARHGVGALIERAASAYFHGLKLVVAGLLGIMIVMIFGNVVLRYVFNSGISIYDELSRWCLVWLTFLGSIVAFRERKHLGMDFVLLMLPPRLQRLLLVAGNLLMLYATWLLLSGSWLQTVLNWDVPAATTGISTGLYYGVGLIFSLSTGIMIVADIVGLASGRLTVSEVLGAQDIEAEAAIGQGAAAVKGGPSP